MSATKMQTNQIKDLIKRYLSNNCTDAEKALVEQSYLHFLPEYQPLKEEDLAADLEFIKANLPVTNRPRSVVFAKKWLVAAAVLLIVCTGTLYYLGGRENKKVIAKNVEKIVPGTDQAILTLADGRRIILDKKASNLYLDSAAGIKISKTRKGEIVYEAVVADAPAAATSFNTIETPRGSQYKIVLQDGTKVWLNAASSLRYPVSFSGNKREVQLVGEAYFEVAKNQKMPFFVHSNQQDIEVLGTHFNVSAYPDDRLTETTLLEGKVTVARGREEVTMLPGDQVVNSEGGKKLRAVKIDDPSESIAWKNGLFLFNHNDLPNIMSKISRWYNVDVVYQGDFTDQYYSGTISKFGEVTDVLKIMQLTGSVKFKISGRRIIVMK